MRYQKPRINVRPSFRVYTSYQDLCAIEKLQGRYELAITSMMNLTFSLSLSLAEVEAAPRYNPCIGEVVPTTNSLPVPMQFFFAERAEVRCNAEGRGRM